MNQNVCILLLVLLCACTDAPNFDDVPSMTFDGLINDTLSQSTLEDTVFIQFTVTDANGDIGENRDGQPSIFMTDEKDGFELPPFTLPEFSVEGAGKGVEASITLLFIIKKGDLCCRFPDGSSGCIESLQYPIDSIFYDMYIQDHVGNESNHVRVGPVYLNCDDPN